MEDIMNLPSDFKIDGTKYKVAELGYGEILAATRKGLKKLKMETIREEAKELFPDDREQFNIYIKEEYRDFKAIVPEFVTLAKIDDEEKDRRNEAYGSVLMDYMLSVAGVTYVCGYALYRYNTNRLETISDGIDTFNLADEDMCSEIMEIVFGDLIKLGEDVEANESDDSEGEEGLKK